jgi:hypothetical protein
MDQRLEDVVEDYSRLGMWLVEKWSAQARTVAARLDAGSYTADTLLKDLTAAGQLAIMSVFESNSVALDALAILTGRQGDRYLVTSTDFESPLPGARLVAGALTAINGIDELPAQAITFEPTELAVASTQFRFTVDATGRQGTLYRGEFQAVLGEQTSPVPVYIAVG